MESTKQQLTNIIPKGGNWASMPIGAMSRIGVYFELWPKKPKKGRPPKYTAQLLPLICEKIQKASLYGEGEQIGVEVSARQLAQELTPPHTTKRVNATTVNSALNWLAENNWIVKDTGKSKGHKTVVTINLEKVKEYATPTDTKPPPPVMIISYKSGKNIFNKLGT